jgi:hypothetical protein
MKLQRLGLVAFDLNQAGTPAGGGLFKIAHSGSDNL